MEKVKNFFKDYNLSIVLFLLFIFSWVGQFVFQFQEYKGTQELHNQPAVVSEFIPDFLSATFENRQSEFLQLLSMVVLTSFLVHKGSHESKDSDEKVDAALARIEAKLNKLEGNS